MPQLFVARAMGLYLTYKRSFHNVVLHIISLVVIMKIIVKKMRCILLEV